VPLLKWSFSLLGFFYVPLRCAVRTRVICRYRLLFGRFVCRLEALLSVDLFVLQSTFADYTARTSFERPLLSGVAYAQRVVHADREGFERHQGWIIKTMKHEPSPAQDEYAPVVYSQETVSYIEGLDMMSGEVCGDVSRSFLADGLQLFSAGVGSEPGCVSVVLQEDRENILRSRASGKAVLTRPFRLMSNHLGVVLTFPVYHADLPSDAKEEDRVAATAG
jgi:arabidopsis histidine kinase 2/3/4 (cytokinin receptor)